MKENKFTNYLNEKLIPLGEKVSNQPHLSAIRDGMVAATPLALLGGLTLILSSVPVDLETIQPTNFINQFLILWKTWANNNWLTIELLHRASMGIMAFFITLVITYSLSRHYKIDPVGSMLTTGVSFLIVSAPSTRFIEASQIDPTMSVEEMMEMSKMAIPMDFLGAEGIFTGIIVALIATELTRFFKAKKIFISMPDSVPAPVKASFESILPLTLISLFFYFTSLIVQNLSSGMLIPELIGRLFTPLTSLVDSPIGIILISVITQLLWLVGLHGSSIVSGVVGAWELGNLASNAESVLQGSLPEYIYTEPFRAFFMIIGGAGATLGLNILMLRSKSSQLKTLGRLAIVPSIFNINEPIIFGTPLVLNPILAIPFIFMPALNALVSYGLMYFDIINKTYQYVHWATPAPLGAALSTYDFRAFILIIILIIVNTLVWYPFFKAYERQLIMDEAEEN